jgi:3-keto-disaccharide hydrolase
MRRLLVLGLLAACCGWGADKQDEALFNGRNLDGWEVRGPGMWMVMENGVLVGERVHPNPADPFGANWPVDKKEYQGWLYRQAWLYTKREFRQYDLHLEYWIPPGGNSGVSIRDGSRAHSAIRESDAERPELAAYPKTTPAHIGYEIQIIDDDREKFQSGSVYTFVPAKLKVQRRGQWNSMDIESRDDLIRVRLNGQVVAEYAGDSARSKRGPIGLQLHDQFTVAMFRNIRIREK